MNSKVLFLVMAVGWMCSSVEAQEPDEAPIPSRAPSSVQFTAELGTVFPAFVGIGGSVIFSDHYQLGLDWGQTPKPYSDAIGSAAASAGGNSSYKDVVQSAFQNNSLWRVHAQYNFENARKGWRLTLAASNLSSSGKAGIDQVLAAATGKDYSQLKNLLTATGRSTEVDMSTKLSIGEVSAGYAWEFGDSWSVGVSVGWLKVLSSDVQLKTGLTNFESTNAGNSLMRSSESELESIIQQNGSSPSAGVSAFYVF